LSTRQDNITANKLCITNQYWGCQDSFTSSSLLSSFVSESHWEKSSWL